MSERLKIYACSGFEATNNFKYLMLDSKRTVDNTQVVNMMLNNINLARTEVAYLNLTKKEVSERLNFIDLCALIVNIAERYADNEKELYAAGEVVTFMLNKGLFQIESTDENERAEHLDKLFSVFDELMAEGVTVGKKEMGWWNEEVMQYRKVGLDEKQRKAVENALNKKLAVSGPLDDLAEHINNGGTYFLYTFFTDEQISQFPKVVERRIISAKKKMQQRTYDYDLALFNATCGNGKQAFDQAIRASIVKRFKEQPEQVCADILAGKKNKEGVGFITTGMWIAIITGIVSILVAAITGICQAVADSNVAKYKAVTPEDVAASVPEADDIDEETKQAGFGSNTLLLAAGAALLYSAISAD